jgi:tripartite-type tricarboxylate transporter receptor subunit TctC
MARWISYVPYKGGALAILDVISGQIQMLITTTVTVGPHLRAGKVRVLAATGPKRVSIYPDIPTVSESGLPGYELTNSYAFYAPAGVPQGVVGKLNAVVIQAMNAPETAKILAADGAEAAPASTSEEFRARFNSDYATMETRFESRISSRLTTADIVRAASVWKSGRFLFPRPHP